MQHLKGSGTPVLYIGRTVLKGLSEAEDFREANVDIKHVIFW